MSKGFIKDPNATLDYSFDWSQWLAGDVISTSTWIVESGLSIEAGSEYYDDTITRVYLSGGVLNQSYTVTNRITTAGSRTDDRSFEIKIRQR